MRTEKRSISRRCYAFLKIIRAAKTTNIAKTRRANVTHRVTRLETAPLKRKNNNYHNELSHNASICCITCIVRRFLQKVFVPCLSWMVSSFPFFFLPFLHRFSPDILLQPIQLLSDKLIYSAQPYSWAKQLLRLPSLFRYLLPLSLVRIKIPYRLIFENLLKNGWLLQCLWYVRIWNRTGIIVLGHKLNLGQNLKAIHNFKQNQTLCWWPMATKRHTTFFQYSAKRWKKCNM